MGKVNPGFLLSLMRIFPESNEKAMVLKLPKIVPFFTNFLLTSARNLNLLKQFIYIPLIDLIMFFQEVACFKGLSNSSQDTAD